jgi:hypothetical protein
MLNSAPLHNVPIVLNVPATKLKIHIEYTAWYWIVRPENQHGVVRPAPQQQPNNLKCKPR